MFIRHNYTGENLFIAICVAVNVLVCRKIAKTARNQQRCIDSLESELTRKNCELRRVYAFVEQKKLAQELQQYQPHAWYEN